MCGPHRQIERCGESGLAAFRAILLPKPVAWPSLAEAADHATVEALHMMKGYASPNAMSAP